MMQCPECDLSMNPVKRSPSSAHCARRCGIWTQRPDAGDQFTTTFTRTDLVVSLDCPLCRRKTLASGHNGERLQYECTDCGGRYTPNQPSSTSELLDDYGAALALMIEEALD
jgi:transposase-like protein